MISTRMSSPGPMLLTKGMVLLGYLRRAAQHEKVLRMRAEDGRDGHRDLLLLEHRQRLLVGVDGLLRGGPPPRKRGRRALREPLGRAVEVGARLGRRRR